MTTERPRERPGDLPFAACLALCTLAPLTALALSGIAPVMPAISSEFADHPSAGVLVRMMMSAFSAAMVVGAIAGGFLAERIGVLRLLIVLLGLYAIAGAGIFLLDNLYAMVAARVVQGIANAGAAVLAMALITTRIAADRRDRWLGFYSVIGAAGIMLLMVAVGSIADFGWRFVFLLFLLAIPSGLFVLLALPPERREQEVSADRGEAIESGGIPWGLAGFGLICGAIVTTIAMYLPYHVIEIGLGGAETVALLMVVGAGASSLTAFSFGWIRKRLSALETFIVGFAVTAAGLVLVVVTHQLPVLYLGMAVHGAGLGVIMPNLFSAAAASVQRDRRARTLGIVRGGIYAGPLAAQPVFEWFMLNWGAGASILAIAGTCMVALAASVIGRELFIPVVEAT